MDELEFTFSSAQAYLRVSVLSYIPGPEASLSPALLP